jgi:hypothetical protein
MNEMPMQNMQQMPPMLPGQPPQPMRQGFFSANKKPEQPSEANRDRTEELMRRLRTLEERYAGLDRRLQVTDQNMISTERRLSSELKTLSTDLLDLKHAVEEVKDRIRMMVDELKESAKIGDVDIIRKYVDYLDPLKFVTQEELEKIVYNIVEDRIAQLQQNDQSMKIVKRSGDEEEPES